MQHKPASVVCFRTDRIGDVILTMPSMACIANTIPDVRVSAVVSGRTSDLLRDQPWLQEVFEWEPSRGMTAILRFLRARKFDTAVHFLPRFTSALACAMTGISLRVGTAYRWFSPLFNRRIAVHRSRNERHEVEYNLDLAAALGADVSGATALIPPVNDPGDREIAERLADSLGLPEGFYVIHPGSLGSALNASPAWYGKLARAMEDAGLTVAVTGTPNESAVAYQVLSAAGLPRSRHITPPGIRVLSAFLRRARGFVGPSTGPLHLAASVGIPVLGLFPPVHSQSPVRWGPRGPQAVVVMAPGKPSPSCMDLIDPAEVIAGLASIRPA